MIPILIDIVLGFGIGLSLGLLGGGGSILTVPALVYLIGQTPQIAITTSLAIVGMNSALGAYFHRSSGTLNWRVALIFGGSGMIVSYFAAGISKQLSPHLLLVVFAGLMLFIGGLMITRRNLARAGGESVAPSLLKVILSGAAVGFLTGILGVGGGFLIVPALVMLVGLPMHTAVGTSLIVISMNSAAGFFGHISGVELDLRLIAVFVLAGLVGTLIGTRLCLVMNAGHLRRAFAIFVIGLALFLLVDNLPKLLAERLQP